MKKFIATIAAAALAVAGSVVVAPSSSAEVNLEIIDKRSDGLTLATPIRPGSVLALSREQTRIVDGEELVNCGISAVPQGDTDGTFNYNQLAAVALEYAKQKGNCDTVKLSVVEWNAELTDAFNGINHFAGQTFGLKEEYPLYPTCAPEDTYGDAGEWCYEFKYGNQPTLIDRVSTEV